MESNNNNETSFLKKMLDFFKKNPVLGSSIATIILYVIGAFFAIIIIAVIMYQVVAMFSSLFGIKETDLSSGKYADKTLEELQATDFCNCYQTTSSNSFSAFWNELLGTNPACELIDLVNSTIEKTEKQYSDFDLELSPGLVISSIIYSYSSSPVSEGEERVDPGQPLKVLEAIAKDKLFTESDIVSIVNNMIFYETYWYYNCNEVNCDKYGQDIEEDTLESDIRSGKQCSKSLYFDVKFSREKYEVFLRYGEDAASYYEAAQNHNKSLSYICDTCYIEWRNDDYYNVELDTKKYLNSVNPDTDSADNSNIVITSDEANILNEDISDINSSNKLSNKYKPNITVTSGKTFTYKDGFIYNKFPNYKLAFESGTLKENEIYTFKTIEKSIKSMENYEEALNKIYGIEESISSEYKGYANSNLETLYKKTECPSNSSCDCSNGNARPYGGNSQIGDYYGEFCTYLGNSNIKIRLYTCKDSKYAYASPSSALPGGAHSGVVNGSKVYVANQSISMEQYIKGVGVSEGYASGPIEAIKFQMLIAQSYMLSSVMRNNSFNSTGEIQVPAGSCFQNYKQTDYNKKYLNGTYKSKVDEAYEAIKNQLLINDDDSITDARYNSTLTKFSVSMANSGMTYENILNTDTVRTFKGTYYNTSSIKTCGYTNLPFVDNNVAQIALSYVSKDTGKDCSGFTRLVLRQAGLTSQFSGASCEGDTRGSYGMYLTMQKNNRIVWQRSSGISTSSAISTFPGGCKAGDLIFYSQGNDTCVRHVAIYIGQESGKYKIVDTTESRSIAEYRNLTSLGNNWIPLACARPY